MSTVNKREDNENYTTLTLRISREFRQQIADAAEKERMTTTQWLSILAREKIEGTDHQKIINDDVSRKLDSLESKTDTIINLISKL